MKNLWLSMERLRQTTRVFTAPRRRVKARLRARSRYARRRGRIIQRRESRGYWR